MISQRHFRLLLPSGVLTSDTFVLPAEQPRTIKPGCVLVVHERSGDLLTVHDTRLFPTEVVGTTPVVAESKRPCFKCGKVQGVIEDQVSCPEKDGAACGLLERREQEGHTSIPASA